MQLESFSVSLQNSNLTASSSPCLHNLVEKFQAMEIEESHSTFPYYGALSAGLVSLTRQCFLEICLQNMIVRRARAAPSSSGRDSSACSSHSARKPRFTTLSPLSPQSSAPSVTHGCDLVRRGCVNLPCNPRNLSGDTSAISYYATAGQRFSPTNSARRRRRRRLCGSAAFIFIRRERRASNRERADCERKKKSREKVCPFLDQVFSLTWPRRGRRLL